jgi:hypothetical protein
MLNRDKYAKEKLIASISDLLLLFLLLLCPFPLHSTKTRYDYCAMLRRGEGAQTNKKFTCSRKGIKKTIEDELSQDMSQQTTK